LWTVPNAWYIKSVYTACDRHNLWPSVFLNEAYDLNVDLTWWNYTLRSNLRAIYLPNNKKLFKQVVLVARCLHLSRNSFTNTFHVAILEYFTDFTHIHTRLSYFCQVFYLDHSIDIYTVYIRRRIMIWIYIIVIVMQCLLISSI
jgi:hypothetical protein